MADLGINPKYGRFDYLFIIRKPTFVFSECVLIYIDPEAVNTLFQFITKTFTCSLFMDYEMFNPKDRFG